MARPCERYRRSEEFIRALKGIIGTPEQIARRIVHLKSIGVNLILTAFLHFQEEFEYFGRWVLPLVRALEQRGAPTRLHKRFIH